MTVKIGETIWRAFEIVEQTHRELINLKKNYRDLLEEEMQKHFDDVKTNWMKSAKDLDQGWCFYSDLLVDITRKTSWDPDSGSLNTICPFWSVQFDCNRKNKSSLDNVVVSLFPVLFWDDEAIKSQFGGEPQLIVAISYLGSKSAEAMEDDATIEMILDGLELENYDLEIEVQKSGQDGFTIITKPDAVHRENFPEKIVGFKRPLTQISDEAHLKRLIVDPIVEILLEEPGFKA